MSCTDKCVRARVKVPLLIVNESEPEKEKCISIGRLIWKKSRRSFFTLRSLAGSGIRRCNNFHTRSRNNLVLPTKFMPEKTRVFAKQYRI